MIDDEKAAARCLGDVDVFARDFWGRRPLVRRSAGPFDDLIDVDTVEALLGQLGRRPTFRVVRAGATIPVSDYTKRSRVGGVEIDDVADVERVLELVAGGATVVLQGLQRTWPPIETFCRDLERTASHRVQANAYLSPPGAAGLKPHADLHDVVVLQVAGTKCWDIAGLGELELEAGDSVYVPAHTRHAAWTNARFSLHLTIGIMSMTHRRAVHEMIDRLDIGLDRPLPFGYATAGRDDELVADLGVTIRDLAERLSHVTPAAEAARQIDRRRRSPPNGAPGRLAVAVDPTVLNDHTRLRLRPGTVVDVHAETDGVIVQFRDRRLRFPPSAADALAVVASQVDFTIEELTGLDEQSRAVVARRLVREGLLEIAR